MIGTHPKLMLRMGFFFLRAIMLLLCDTCIIYDWMMDTLKDECCIEKIQTEGGHVSQVTVWEMAIKNGLGKMPLPSALITKDIESHGFQWLNITPYHTQAILELPTHHKDPFDRLLIAQAKYETLRVVTYDSIFKDYLDDVLIVKK